MSTTVIARIERAANGWLVTAPKSTPYLGEETHLCMTWEEVLEQLKQSAFHYDGRPKGR